MLKQLIKVVKEWLKGTEVTDILPQQTTKVVTLKEVQNMFQEGILKLTRDANGLRIFYKNQVVADPSNEIVVQIQHFIDKTREELKSEYNKIYQEFTRFYDLFIECRYPEYRDSFVQVKSELNKVENRMYRDWNTFSIDSFLSLGGYELIVDII